MIHKEKFKNPSLYNCKLLKKRFGDETLFSFYIYFRFFN